MSMFYWPVCQVCTWQLIFLLAFRIYWNSFRRYVSVYYLAVNCAFLELVPSLCQNTFFYFALSLFLSFFSSLHFSSLVIIVDANDICKDLKTRVYEHSLPDITKHLSMHLNKSLDKYTLPKIWNDVCEHLNTSVSEHFQPVLTIR